VLDELKNLSSKKYVSPYDLAIACLGAGKTDQAIALLGRAVDERCPRTTFLGVDPRFGGLRGDARFKTLAGRVAPPA
jgi:hypothetical protein